MGAGRFSCGHWLEIRRTRDTPHDVRFTQAREWLDGFLSAYNLYLFPGGNVAAGTDNEGIHDWMDNYCRENPAVMTIGAAKALIQFLTGRQ